MKNLPSAVRKLGRLATSLCALGCIAVGCSEDPGTCSAGARCADVVRRDVSADAPPPPPDVLPIDVPDPALRDVVSIEIEPANPTITCVDGMRATQMFRAIGVQRDGMRLMLTSGSWSLEHDRLGSIGNDGVFTANGIASGVVEVRVEAPDAMGMTLRATTRLSVRVERTIVAMGTPMDAATHFMDPVVMDAARAVLLHYPLDNAMMPNNVGAPDVQWERGAAGDVYRVRIVKPGLTVTAYVLHTGMGFRYDWVVESDAWRSVAENSAEEPAVISVDRWDSAMRQVVPGPNARVLLARSGIFGAIYYWDLGGGRIQRINAVTGARDSAIPNPPVRTSDGRRCVACHTVSRDGRYLGAELWDGGSTSTVFDLTTDLTPDPSPTVFPPGRVSFLFSTFSPDSTRLITNFGNGLGLIDPRTGMSVAATGLPTTGSAHPEWSPDGNSVAFITNTDGGWAVDFTRGDLAMLPVMPGDTFLPAATIHRGSDLAGMTEGGNVDAHPTWAPDSRVLAFQHAIHSRSDGGGGRTIASSLYLVARAGGAAARLNNAVGGPSETTSYWPTFSPFITRDRMDLPAYYWLAFFSRRPYGNTQAGTRGSSRRQLWVTAVRTDAPPGADPSSVAYWLPGQDVASQNMAAFWAPQPCRMNSADCRTSADCCSGSCRPDPMMPMRFTCQPPPPAECRRLGATCGAGGDCCMGLTCVGNTCVSPPG